MSIKARLLLSISLAVSLALLLIGVATVTITRDQLIDRVDETLVSAANRPPLLPDGNNPRQSMFGKRATASMLISADGQTLMVEQSGFSDDPDPVPALTIEQIASNSGEIFTAEAEGTGERFRVLPRPLDDDVYYVTAAPLGEVDDTIRNLTLVIVVTGITVLLVLTAVVWFTIRRGLRPIDSMIHTAGLIGSGDLSQRVTTEDSDTEVGQLGQALNDMLVQIETSFAAKEASERRLRQFVADASHELRTPLTSIRGYAELYRTGAAASPEGIERVIGRIESEGARMGRLVEDLLLLARLDQGRPLEYEAFDLVELANQAVMDARVVDPERDITFRRPPSAFIVGDRNRLRQVLDNLLTNARIHTDPGTPITVTVESGERTVSIVVHDEGLGIPPEDAPHIFDRFYRADVSRSRASGGSGLGLAIVASIVDAHGGSVALNTAPGAGTTITITLNRHEPTATSVESNEKAIRP